jgi:hypothetical protein
MDSSPSSRSLFELDDDTFIDVLTFLSSSLTDSISFFLTSRDGIRLLERISHCEERATRLTLPSLSLSRQQFQATYLFPSESDHSPSLPTHTALSILSSLSKLLSSNRSVSLSSLSLSDNPSIDSPNSMALSILSTLSYSHRLSLSLLRLSSRLNLPSDHPSLLCLFPFAQEINIYPNSNSHTISMENLESLCKQPSPIDSLATTSCDSSPTSPASPISDSCPKLSLIISPYSSPTSFLSSSDTLVCSSNYLVSKISYNLSCLPSPNQLVHTPSPSLHLNFPLFQGLKYLSFHLKPLEYSFNSPPSSISNSNSDTHSFLVLLLSACFSHSSLEIAIIEAPTDIVPSIRALYSTYQSYDYRTENLNDCVQQLSVSPISSQDPSISKSSHFYNKSLCIFFLETTTPSRDSIDWPLYQRAGTFDIDLPSPSTLPPL